ncbi:hypothetical protein CRUP_003674 [Coryphaenoides rupestris]|nr:hypothetical protein CRUP_003674 [Coryphaenoides rupestris]
MYTMNPEQSSCSTPEGRKVNMRTPNASFKRVHSSFKSPAQAGVRPCAGVTPGEEVKDLMKRLEEQEAEIAALVAEGYRLDELGQHIDLLHEYNDVKDIGQTLLGRIAALRGTTTRSLYGHFGLELSD